MSREQYIQCLNNHIFTRADQKIIDQYLDNEKINHQTEYKYITELKNFTDSAKYAIIVYFSDWFDDNKLINHHIEAFINVSGILFNEIVNDAYISRSVLKYKMQFNSIVKDAKVLDYLHGEHDQLIRKCISIDTYEPLFGCNIDELLQIAMKCDIHVACRFDIKWSDEELNTLIDVGYKKRISWNIVGKHMNEQMIYAFMRYNPISLLYFSKYIEDDMLRDLASMDSDKNQDKYYCSMYYDTLQQPDDRFEQFGYHTLPVIVYNLSCRKYNKLTAYDTERVNSYKMYHCNDVRLLADILITYPYSFAMIMNKKTKHRSEENILAIYKEYKSDILPQLEYASRFSDNVCAVYSTLPHTYSCNPYVIDITFFAENAELQYNPLACFAALNKDPRNIIYAKCSDLQIYDNFLKLHPDMLELIPALSDDMMVSLIKKNASNAHKKPIHSNLIRLLHKNKHLAEKCKLTKEEMAEFINDNESYCRKKYLQRRYNKDTEQFYDAVTFTKYPYKAYKYDIGCIKSIKEWYFVLSCSSDTSDIIYTLVQWLRINVEYLFFDGAPISMYDDERLL